MKTFSKRPYAIQEQIQLLKDRGMVIEDDDHAAFFLSYCSYYRFCGYALPFEYFLPDGTRLHKYKEGTTFETIEKIYHFDGALRRLLFHYLTLIEIGFRNVFCNEIAIFYNDAHWYMKPDAYCNNDAYENLFLQSEQEVKRSKEVFIKAYKENYNTPNLPPIWMLTEIMSFSFWSKSYQNLKEPELRNVIASIYGIPEKYMISWLRALAVLRNACAHHARVWNRNFSQLPLISPRIFKKIPVGQHPKLASFLLILKDFLRKNKRDDDFKNDMIALFDKYPKVPFKRMGIPCPISEFLA